MSRHPKPAVAEPAAEPPARLEHLINAALADEITFAASSRLMTTLQRAAEFKLALMGSRDDAASALRVAIEKLISLL